MKILHTADIHWCREHQAEALASLVAVRDTARAEQVDLVVFAGDLFDRGIQASDRDGLPALLEVVTEILNVAPVVAVYGTPTHDVAGCYEVLTRLKAEHPLVVLDPREPFVMGDARQDKLLVLGCPEPGKEWLLAGKEGLDGQTAAQAAKDAMRGLLLGLGSMRRQHPDIPCLMVYHGSVRGATMSSGQTVGAGELAIGVEDLALVGADYYALGHIHQGQQLQNEVLRELPCIAAYYAGSAYPVDWGELEQKSFNLVAIDDPDYGDHVKRIPFPHPPRAKIESDGVSLDVLLDDHGIRGKQVWLMVRNTKENLADLNEEEMLSYLVDVGGALPGSRVTLEALPTETVRAAEITEATRLKDKVAIYAGASGTNYTPAVLEKADALEAEARAAGTVGEGAYIRLRSLRLRGAIGIWKGLGLDEVTLDLDDYDRGLVALVGPNGAGKSTLIENLHPYPEMLTRGGSLQSHFRLKDSCRELDWTDERDGTEYRALILIDPTLATPKAEYHLSAREPAGTWQPITNGRKEDYLRAVTELWGSIDLFLRSAFVAQKPPKGHPDLADATPAERKALFRELGGLDYLQTYAEAAKGKADAIASEIEIERGKVAVIRPLLEQEPERRQQLDATIRLSEEASLRVGVVRADGKQQRALVEKLGEKAREQERIAVAITALVKERAALDDELGQIDIRIANAEMAQTARGAAEAVLRQAEDLTKAREALQDEQTRVLRERERLSAEHAGRLAAVRSARDEVQAEIRRLEKYAARLEAQKAALVAQVDAVAPELDRPLTLLCPTCGQALPPEKCEEIARERKRTEEVQRARQEQIIGVDNALLENEQGRKVQEARLAGWVEPKPPELPTFDQAPALEAVLAQVKRLDVARAKETLRRAEAAGAEIAAAKERQVAIGLRLDAIQRQSTELGAQINHGVVTELAEAKGKLDALHEQYAEATARASRLDAEVTNLRAILEDLDRKRATLAEIEQGIEQRGAELEDWRYLERACGRDGIQALELDALGPSIAEVANRLLDAAYGSRFRIEIRTTRIAGRGSKTKSVEDFELVIHDAEAGTEQPLDTLSGGEATWVRRALYDAFAAIRANSTGTRFLTVIQDESDGALDPEARLRYFRMIEAAHAASGRYHTLIVTHSEMAQEMIAQRIEMSDLAEARKEAVA